MHDSQLSCRCIWMPNSLQNSNVLAIVLLVSILTQQKDETNLLQEQLPLITSGRKSFLCDLHFCSYCFFYSTKFSFVKLTIQEVSCFLYPSVTSIVKCHVYHVQVFWDCPGFSKYTLWLKTRKCMWAEK